MKVIIIKDSRATTDGGVRRSDLRWMCMSTLELLNEQK